MAQSGMAVGFASFIGSWKVVSETTLAVRPAARGIGLEAAYTWEHDGAEQEGLLPGMNTITPAGNESPAVRAGYEPC